MNSKNFSIRELCYIAIFAAIIMVCAQITIPMPYGVPMTLQTFAIPLAGVVLGIKNGTTATLVYVLLGLMGVPVFAGFTGGIGIVFGRTGGFIMSFPLMALAAGIGANCSKKNNLKNNLWLALWLIIGAVVNYICGMLMFSFIHFGSISFDNLIASFSLVVVPFIPTAIIKIIMVLVLGRAIERNWNKMRSRYN